MWLLFLFIRFVMLPTPLPAELENEYELRLRFIYHLFLAVLESSLFINSKHLRKVTFCVCIMVKMFSHLMLFKELFSPIVFFITV